VKGAVRIGIFAAVMAVSFPVAASDELARKYACSACHTIDTKLVGPAFKEIAAKYRDDKAAPARLAEKIKKGSQGVWGSVPMPPNPTVPDADVNALVSWILSQ
jgi:cytochrome c